VIVELEKYDIARPDSFSVTLTSEHVWETVTFQPEFSYYRVGQKMVYVRLENRFLSDWIGYGNPWSLVRFDENTGEWVAVNEGRIAEGNTGFTLPMYVLQAGKGIVLAYDLTLYHSGIPEGLYRINMKYSLNGKGNENVPIYAEFKITSVERYIEESELAKAEYSDQRHENIYDVAR